MCLRMPKMLSIKVPHNQCKFHLILLISLSFAVTETRRHQHSDMYDFGNIVYPSDKILAQIRLGASRTTTAMPPDPAPDIHIPADLMEVMRNIGDTDELYEKYFIGNEEDFPIWRDSEADNGLTLRSGSRIDVREDNGNFVSRPHMPPCEPRPTPVHLATPRPGYLLTPPCLMVPRCGACCVFGSKCRPVATETFVYSVLERVYISSEKAFKITRRVNVTEEHHTACECQCDIKPQDCHRRGQIFDETHCKCMCRYEFENSAQCLERNLHQWNSDTCTCDCIVLACPEDYFFNQEKCQCDF